MEVTKYASQQPFIFLKRALSQFFGDLKSDKSPSKRKGFPVFKKKRYSSGSFYIGGDMAVVKKGSEIKDKRFGASDNKPYLHVPKFGWVMLREEICFPGKINSVTISQDGDKFFASFSIETSEIIYEATHRENVREALCGCDWGVKDLLTLSNGIKIKGSKHLRRRQRQLSRQQRKLAKKLYKWSNWNSLLNPVAVSIVTVVILLMATHTPYQTYFSGAQFIHFLLGPTTVALAVPLYDLRIQLAKNWLPILLGLFAGAVTAITSTVLIAGLLGASPETIISLAPKSVTTPIAMSIAEKLGGLPALSASLVVLTGVLGSICAGPLFLLLKVDSSSAKGFALGLSAHGMGTSRAFQIDATAGAYGSLAIGLTGLTTAILAPLLTPLLMKLFF
jgi:predicted murein hydrolase (TIGR00659 family)